MKERIKVAVIADSPFLMTGFANVARSIMTRLPRDEFELHVLGVMHYFIPNKIDPYETYEPVPTNDPMGFRATITFLQRVNPDVLFLIGDPGTLRNRFGTMKLTGRSSMLPAVTYFPIEGIPMGPHVEEQAKMVHGPVTYTKWGQEQLAMKGIDVDYIWHGLDHENFHQYSAEDRQKLRRVVGWEDKFVIGMVGVNKRTNRQPALFEMAKNLIDRGVDDFVLYVHCEEQGDVYMGGWELGWILDEFGVGGNVIMKQAGSRFLSVPAEGNEDPLSLPEPTSYDEALKNLGKLGYMDILNLFDVILDPASAHGFNLPCFLPGTLTQVPNGISKIENIDVGDRVLSDDGRFHRVVNVFETPYVGPIVKIHALGLEYINATMDHPFLCIQRHGDDKKSRDYAKKDIPEWITACEIRVGDYLCVPRKKEIGTLPESIDLAELCPGAKVDGDSIYYESGYCSKNFGYGSIADMFGVSKVAVRQILAFGAGDSYGEKEDILEWAKDNYDSPKQVRYNRILPCEPDLFRLLGYYAAEGCCGSGFVDFAFHSKETEYHSDVAGLISRYFGKDVCTTINGNKTNLKFSGKPIVRFFSELVGNGAHNKHVPFIESISGRAAEEFVIGAWRGDGCISGGFKYSTASESLAYGLADILLRIGFYASVSRKYREDKGITFTITISGKQAVEFEKLMHLGYCPKERTGQNFWMDDKYVYVPVLSVQYVPHSGFVYNMEVEDTNTYTANRAVVHNCAEAARCGVPIIMVDDGFARSEIYGDVAYMMKPTASDYWHTGAVLPLVSPKAMADAVLEMKNDKAMRDRYAVLGKERFDNCKWQPVADLFADKIRKAHTFAVDVVARGEPFIVP